MRTFLEYIFITEHGDVSIGSIIGLILLSLWIGVIVSHFVNKHKDRKNGKG